MNDKEIGFFVTIVALTMLSGDVPHAGWALFVGLLMLLFGDD
jgi:hypothetical protein